MSAGFVFPSSFAQERLWFVDRLFPGTAAYNVPSAVRLLGALDVRALADALERTVARHESLRTTLAEEDGRIVQLVRERVEVRFPLIDLAELSREAVEEETERLVAEEAASPFDLVKGPLFRASLIRGSSRAHVVRMTLHHAISDGGSMAVLFREIGAAYARLDPGPALEIQYGDFAIWQREHVRSSDLQFWREELSDLAPLDLPGDRPRPLSPSLRGRAELFSLTPSLAADLRALARRERTTLSNVLLTAFAALVHRLTGRDDFAIGTPISERPRAELERLIGNFLNLLPLRVRLDEHGTLRDLLERVRALAFRAYAHREVPFERLVAELGGGRDRTRAPLFDVMFVFQRALDPVPSLPDLEIVPIPIAPEAAKLDLVLSFVDTPRALEGSIEYAADLYSAATIRAFIEHLRRILEALAATPELSLGALPIATAAVRTRIARGKEDRAFLEATVEEGIAARARKTPDAIAVECDGTSISYGALWARASALADRLKARGAGCDVPIGVQMRTSVDLVIALVAIWESGSAYVPLDPEHPAGRIERIVRARSIPFVLSSLDVSEHPPIRSARANGRRLESLAYVMHTSGSTGSPKSVGVTRKSVANVIASMSEAVALERDDVWLSVSPIGFDISALEIFAPLVAGARTVLVSRDVARDGLALRRTVEQRRPTILQATPSTWRMLIDAGWSQGQHIRAIAGGEALHPSLAAELRARVAMLWNAYGPTETTIWSSLARVDSEDVTLGAPLANTEIMVLDDVGGLAPIAAIGEIAIGGAGLARGYLGAPELTAERFVPHPSSATAGARIYRTGDLGRLRSDGTLEWMGRADRELKLRGVRIDPGEIERALLGHSGVKEAAVLAVGSGGARTLIAFWTASPDSPPLESALREALAGTLPEALIPRQLVRLDALPRTPNGKIDFARLALRSEALSDPAAASIDGPRSTHEAVLSAIWSEVLRVERVSPSDDFFQLGGHSLLSTRVAAAVRETFGVELSIRAFFEAPTLRTLAAIVEEAQLARTKSIRPPLTADRARPRVLSFGQERLWFLEQLEPGTPLLNIPAAVRLRGALDVPALIRAFGQVIDRHEILRTVYPAIDGAPSARVLDRGSFVLPLVDLSALDPRTGEAELARIAEEGSRDPFDLVDGPLIRGQLFSLSREAHALAIVVHHIAADAGSMDLFARELAALYGGRSLPPPAVQYADFADWQRAWLTDAVTADLLDHWRARLDGATPLTFGPAGRRTGRGRTVPFRIPEETARSLRAIARDARATMFMLMLAALKTWIHRFTGETDLSIGAPVSQRALRALEPLIGFFVNTLVFRTDLSAARTFESVLRRVRETCLLAYEHQWLPFEKLVADLSASRRGAPLFQVLLILQDAAGERLSAGDLEIEPIAIDTKTAHFDLTVTVIDQPGALWGTIEYDLGLFDRGSAEQMARGFESLLEAVARDPAVPITALVLGDDSIAIGAPIAATPPLVHRSIEARATEDPDRIAVIAGDRAITYRELDARSNGIAHRIADMSFGPEPRVGLLARPDADLVPAMIGILKAGAAYVPIDPALPSERIAFMIRDAKLCAVIAPRALSDLAGACATIDPADVPSSARPPAIRDHGSRAAYVIYTSGSTGVPKGVVVEHRSLAAFTEATRRAFGIRRDDRVLQFASIAWDTSAEEIYPALTVGACVVMREARMLDSPAALRAACDEQRVTVVDLPTAYWHELTRAIDLWPSLSTVVIGGERARADRVEAWHEAVRGRVRLLNSYGATETTAITAVGLLEPGLEARGIVPAGRAVGGVRAYVLDRDLSFVPRNGFGELYVGGEGVARGYVERPDLTAERFVPDPHAGVAGARMYATGDRARMRDDGTIELLGRADDQIKVRGHRVELGEIEAAVARHPGVAEAAAIAPEDGSGDRGIALFVVRAQPIGAVDLRVHAREVLPAYMAPSAIVFLDALPKTTSGKIDRRRLHDLVDRRDADRTRAIARPRTPEEEILAEIWREVLEREAVGIDEDFFDLGGHSLRATRVVSRIRRVLGLEVPLREIFDHATIASLAERIRGLRRDASAEATPIRRVPREQGELDPSFAQARLWFLEKLNGPSATYNMPIGVHFRGALSMSSLVAAVNALVARHESLRTSFGDRSGRPTLNLASALSLEVPLVDLGGLGEDVRTAEAWRVASELARAPFDLDRAPLARFCAVRLGAEEWGLLAIFHHTICDAWSLSVIARELELLYQGRAAELPPLPVEYADWAAWERARLDKDGAIDHWARRLEGAEPLELPIDSPRTALAAFVGSAHAITLSRELSDRLRALSRSEGVSVFMTLLALFSIVLHRYTGQDDITVGSPVANRGRSEIEGLVGLFVNMIVLRNDLSGTPPFSLLLGRVRATCLEAYEHQSVPFERIVEHVRPSRDLGKSPLFQVGFALNDAVIPSRMFAHPIAPLGIDTGTAKFDLSLAVLDTGEGFIATFEYNASLFERHTIARLADQFARIADAASCDPSIAIGQLPMLGEADRARCLVAWSGPAVDQPALCLHELVERAAERTPAATAVSSLRGTLTYRALLERAHAIAAELSERGVSPEARAVVLMERSPEMIAAILGVLEAGGAYVPIDPSLPRDRIHDILGDVQPRIVIADAASMPLCEGVRAPVWLADTGPKYINSPPRRARTSPDNLAYVIYTSGSTGRPKGAMNTHRAVVNRLSWAGRAFAIERGQRILQKTSIGFDVSVWEIFLPLIFGAELVLAPPRAERDTAAIARLIAEERISTVHFVPPALDAWLDSVDRPEALVRVIASGDVMSPHLAARFHAKLPGVELYNLYGPTEAAIDVTAWRSDPGAQPASVPIGRPIDNVRAYVLEPSLQLAPIGARGELWIGGIAPARGYFASPALTAERFLPDPYVGVAGARMYRTGDRARWRADGVLEFLGRIDRQIKIRGARVEPLEIEEKMRAHPAIRTAAVVAHAREADTVLVAYFVAESDPAPKAKDLSAFLRRRLPDHAVPAFFVALPALPMSANGKIDLRALPKATALHSAEKPFAAPRTPIERELAGMFADLLGVDRAGVDEDFFELGGHSLLLTRLSWRIGEAFVVELSLAEMFERPTVEGMSELISIHLARAAEAEELERVFAEIADLSPDEVARALEAESG
jgi:amino acid adenylation domain-containing protein